MFESANGSCGIIKSRDALGIILALQFKIALRQRIFAF